MEKKTTDPNQNNRWRALGQLLLIFIILVIIVGTLVFAILSVVSSPSSPSANNTNEPGTYRELITYADHLEVFIYDGNRVKKSRLAGNYNVITNEINSDNKQRDQRIVTLQLKDSGYTFEVESLPDKCEPFEALCFRYIYNTSTTFNYITYQDYLLTQYNQSVNHDTSHNVQKGAKTYFSSFVVDSQTTLNYTISYLENFIDFCNHLTYRIPGRSSVSINFPTDDPYFEHKTASVSIILDDSGNYVMTFPSGYQHDNTLRSYLESFMETQKVLLNS